MELRWLAFSIGKELLTWGAGLKMFKSKWRGRVGERFGFESATWRCLLARTIIRPAGRISQIQKKRVWLCRSEQRVAGCCGDGGNGKLTDSTAVAVLDKKKAECVEELGAR
jgi:hypothetical protein